MQPPVGGGVSRFRYNLKLLTEHLLETCLFQECIFQFLTCVLSKEVKTKEVPHRIL